MPPVPRPYLLHRLAARGDAPSIRALLRGRSDPEPPLDGFDPCGRTPLMRAVAGHEGGTEAARLLLEAGARVDAQMRDPEWECGRTALSVALSAGNLGCARLLLDAGAAVHYRRAGEATALIEVARGPGRRGDPAAPDLVRLLLWRGVLAEAPQEEQGRILLAWADAGRYDVVRLLLEQGLDEAPLRWSPLIRATAIGSVAEIEALGRAGADLESTDAGGRTAWLVAAQIGSVPKAEALRHLGVDPRICASDARSAPASAVDGHHIELLRWLLGIGFEVDGPDDFDDTLLRRAVEMDDAEAVKVLLAAGARLDAHGPDRPLLFDVRSRRVAKLILDAGADPQDLRDGGHRALAGLPPDTDELVLADVEPSSALSSWTRRFGRRNPDPMRDPFWEAMVRSGASGFGARRWFGEADPLEVEEPAWSAQRFGRTTTLLPDGRAVQIGGEHEDWYDSDFCIYNDVCVFRPDGELRILGYPSHVFPPTDFHTATLLGDSIYVVGSLGYAERREPGRTPVYRLDLGSFSFVRVDAAGPGPGWIHGHRATLVSDHEIRITGGKIVRALDQPFEDNTQTFLLDVRVPAWRRVGG